MNKLYLGVNVFNDINALVPCFESVVPFIDGAIVVDGSYQEYPTPHDYSNDGSVEFIESVLRKHKKEFILIKPLKRMTEVQKRNQYCEYMNTHMDYHNTWLIIWDADFELVPEVGHTKVDMEQEWLSLRSMDMNQIHVFIDMATGSDHYVYSESMPNQFSRATFTLGYRAIKGLHYKNKHFKLFNFREDAFAGFVSTYVMKHSRILNWFQLKSNERINERSEYLTNVVKKYE